MIFNKYVLEVYRGMAIKYKCPGCNRDNSFQRYVYKNSGIQVANDVGICFNKKLCGYDFHPVNYFKENKILPNPNGINNGPSFIPQQYLTKSLKNYEDNNFVLYLNQKFGIEKTNQAKNKYHIGTSRRWSGSTVFWQINKHNNIHNGRIILFNSETGRCKIELVPFVQFVHQSLDLPKFNATQCLFGEHLLKDEPNKPIIIMKDEREAIISSILYPEYNWLASNGLSSPNAEMCKAAPGAIWYPENGYKLPLSSQSFNLNLKGV